MNKIEIADFEKLTQKLMSEFPNIIDKKTPVSLLGVSSRVYNYWIKEGIVPKGKELDSDKSAWIKLNLYDFVWIKAVAILREMKFPFKEIVKLKKKLSVNIADEMMGKEKEYLEILREHSNLSESEIEVQRIALELAVKHRNGIPEEYKVLYSEFGALINRVFIHEDEVSLIIYKHDKGYKFELYSRESSNTFKDLDSDWRNAPRIEIPLAPIVYQFLEDPKNEKNIEAWGFINKNEKKVLEAMRLNDFTEIIIRLQGAEKEMIIEKVKDGDIKDQKAKEIRRILGLNQYSEITIKYRNDKHLYFKGKNRL